MKKQPIRRIIAGLSALLMAASASSLGTFAVTAANTDVIYGDANCDGSVTVADVVQIMQCLANPSKYSITDKGADNADVFDRGDGITSMDALSIQRHLLGLLKELPESWKEAPPEQIDVETSIHLKGSSITVDGEYAEVSGNTVTITHSGAFTIDGKLTDGQICVNIPDEKADSGTVKLFLNGVEITGRNAPAIYIINAENTSINLMDGTENFISDSESPYTGDFAESAVIEAKDDLTIKSGDLGTGKLTLTANCQNGISCNNDIKITGGVIDISALNKESKTDAVKGKKSVKIKGGEVTVKAEGDGIKSSKGSIVIEGGTISVKAGNDAVQAETDLTISGGSVAACGDRGLRSEGTVNISGGTVLATATDYQCENLTASQGTFLLGFVKEWQKNNPIAVSDASGKTILDINTPKKFSYAVVSSPELKDGSNYKVYAGGIQMFHDTDNADFKAAMPASYTDVNNNDSSELLYGMLFNQTMVHNIDVKMSESEWNNFIANADKEEYYPCDVAIDGELYKNVGIRTKGNSSRMFVSQAKKDKFSFRIKLNEYDKMTNYHGLTEFCINNMYSDPSCMRDILCYNAMYEIDGYAPKCSYTDMYLNGKLYSFYFLAEQPGTTLAERLANDNEACLYKAADVGNNYDCTFSKTMSLDNFDLKFGNDESKQHIVEVVQAINSVTPSNYKFVEDTIDVDSFLKGFAVNAIMCNYDSYNGMMAHNYYVMYNKGKMHYVGWDYNLSLGNFMDYGASAESDIKTGLYNIEADKRPMIKNLLAVPEYYERYVKYVKQITAMYSDPEQSVAKFASLIREHVKNDPRFFFTAEQFESNIAKSPNGLQINNGGGGGMWGGGFGGMWGGGFGGMWGGGGGLFSYGGEQVSIIDFMIKRWDVIRSAFG